MAKKKVPYKTPENKNKWGELNQQLLEAMEKSNFHGMKMAYFEMALHVWENTDKDFIPYLILANQMELQNYKNSGVVSKVYILTAQGQCCEACQQLHGKTYTIEEALQTNPIPCLQCTWPKQGARPGWCRCSYNGIVDS